MNEVSSDKSISGAHVRQAPINTHHYERPSRHMQLCFLIVIILAILINKVIFTVSPMHTTDKSYLLPEPIVTHSRDITSCSPIHLHVFKDGNVVFCCSERINELTLLNVDGNFKRIELDLKKDVYAVVRDISINPATDELYCLIKTKYTSEVLKIDIDTGKTTVIL